MVHLIMIASDGTVWDISLDENNSPSKKELLKLPNPSLYYHGYSDDKGILYFINGDLEKKIIKYHPSFNEKGHKTGNTVYIKGEAIFTGSKYEYDGFIDMGHLYEYSDPFVDNDNFCYTQSLQFGNNVWLYGRTFIDPALPHFQREYSRFN